jgi:hypothetical protein
MTPNGRPLGGTAVVEIGANKKPCDPSITLLTPFREWREYSYRFNERQGGPRDHQWQDDASVEICY